MEITVAKHSGFCLGVTNAMEVALSAEGGPIYTLGELIHNPTALAMLEKKGIRKVDSVDEIEGGTVIIRSHGIGEEEYLKLREKGVKIIDATCVFVKNIQRKAREYYEKGYQIVIVGDKNHPEVKGINGWCYGSAIIIGDEENVPDLEPYDKVCVLCQTTFSKEKYDKIVKNIVKDGGKKVEVFNTICYTTIERQKEARELSRANDCVIVIGGKTSSNTQKLRAICEEECSNVFSIETPAQLDLEKLRQFKKVAIVAGASTPRELIKEVYSRMEQMINEGMPTEEVKVQEMTVQQEAEEAKASEPAAEESKAQQEQAEKQEEKSEIAKQEAAGPSVMDQALKQVARGNKFRRGQVIKATIALVGDDGLSLAVGSMKKEILLDKDDVEIDGTYDKTKFAVGDIIEVVVTKTSPLEVSRKQYLMRQRDEGLIEELKEIKDFKVKITATNSGGLTGEYGSLSVFIPASHIKLAYVKAEEFPRYLNKELKVRLLEVKGRTLIASAKEIILEEKKKREEARASAINAFFDSIEVGQVVEGKVVRFTDFGAFVNVNGFDCLAHVSDLSWTAVKKPEDVLEKNKVYEFVILKIDREKEHVSLGYKQLQPKPWDLAAEKYPAGSVIKGKVVRIAPFGAFVEVEPGVDGLVHVSQITHEWIENPASALKVGDEVEAKVLDVNPEAQKLTLSIKALLPEPENEAKPKKKEDKKPKGEKKAKQPKEEEMREWSEESAAASIGDLIKDLNINL